LTGIMTAIASPALEQGSRWVQRVRRKYAQELALLPQGLPTRAVMEQLFLSISAQNHDVGAALRIVRQLVLERLIVLDCHSLATMQQVTLVVSELAETVLHIASTHSHALLTQLHGMPLNAAGDMAQLCIVGMGKLGARELNVSSDIDLVYVYDHDGDTQGDAHGKGRISNQEFFGKLVRTVFALVGESTEHGFVFRIDLALRPNGNSGPSAVSLGALEEYFHVQGREWERFAWLKSRVVAPAHAVQSTCALGLRSVVVPFVYRRYLDYSVFDALRVLHRQIRDHASKRSAGRPERSNDVKLSRGGIREIEFTVQLLQVVRGGQFPELRTRPTLSALERLVQAGLMPREHATALSEAYVFLRNVEHRIQYLDDQQTHVLPCADADLDWIAQTLGFTETYQFLGQLDTHREFVAGEFDALLGGNPEPCISCVGPRKVPREPVVFDDLLQTLRGPFLERISAWQNHPRVRSLRDASLDRLMRLTMRTHHWIEDGTVTQDSAVRLADWMETLLRRESYLALLLERPAIHQRLLRMLGAARWPARYLFKHPGVIDELASESILEERFDPQEFTHELERRRKALAISGEDDEETLLNLLRRAHHAEVFRTLMRDIENRISVEQVADELSALAQAILRIALQWCWAGLKTRHRADHQLGILAYGKLGGLELGYGSDLDLVFVYDDASEQAAEVYGQLVRKFIHWLTVKTSDGDLYEIDTALRPNGNSGLLITSFDAYANYQQQRGSNTAWTWEHQAITRARCVLGSDSLHQQFAHVRNAVLCAPRDALALRDEICAMREKMRQAHPVRGPAWDVKHSPGGMVDIEFAVQYVVLAHAHQHPELRDNVGNIGLLARAQACGLLPASVSEQAAAAYRKLRQLQHQARLNEASTALDFAAVKAESAAGLALWHAVFGASA
jgi:[glutamine synthetase] adenylyltransferase / [glutamine synthetase]-adenylyl-L-tyrosine phosphorylase